MCPVTVSWFRLTWATVEALRIFSVLDNDATIGGLSRELPQYIAATQDVVIECEGKKVEWWRVHEEGLPNWSSWCPLLWLSLSMSGFYVTSPRLPFSQSWGNKTKIQKLAGNYGLKQTQNNFALFYSVTNKEYLGQKYWVMDGMWGVFLFWVTFTPPHYRRVVWKSGRDHYPGMRNVHVRFDSKPASLFSVRQKRVL